MPKIVCSLCEPKIFCVSSKQALLNYNVLKKVGDNFDEVHSYLNSSEIFYKTISEPIVKNSRVKFYYLIAYCI